MCRLTNEAMIKIISSPISKEDLETSVKELFADFVKAVVDVEQGIIAIGGEFHADCESAMLENGCKQPNLWGINIYPEKSKTDRIEFDSMINIRPKQGNRTRDVNSEEIREKITIIVNKLINE